MSYLEEDLIEAKTHNSLTCNEHVKLRKKFLLWIAQQERRSMAQLVYYTELMKEINPNWSPYSKDEEEWMEQESLI
jgi:hypothetical protein